LGNERSDLSKSEERMHRRKTQSLRRFLQRRQVDREKRSAPGRSKEHSGVAIRLELAGAEEPDRRNLFPQHEVFRSPNGNDEGIRAAPDFFEFFRARAEGGRAIELQPTEKVRALHRLKSG
jgi:hypothetical protein